MEIGVCDFKGFQGDSILSIRVGSTRRQAKVSALRDNKLQFPQHLDACENVVVDVLKTVSSVRLVLAPAKENYDLEFPGEQKLACSFHLQRSAGTKGKQVEELENPCVQKNYKDAANSARKYLDETQLLPYVQGLLHAVLQEKPKDPISFLREQIDMSCSERKPQEGDNMDDSLNLVEAVSVAVAKSAAQTIVSEAEEDLRLRSVEVLQEKCFNGDANGDDAACEKLGHEASHSDSSWIMDSAAVLRSANDLVDGEVAVCRETGKEGQVLRRTTTDVLVQYSDGTETWHGVEDLAQAAVLTAAYTAIEGELVAVRSEGCSQAQVVDRTTTDIKVMMEDGKEVWHAVEDVALVLPHALGVEERDEAICRKTSLKGSVLSKTTTDVRLRMADGEEQSFGIEDIALPSSTVSKRREAPKLWMSSCGSVLKHASDLLDGEEGVLRDCGLNGVVLSRTTTDVLLRHADGTEVWYAVEDVGQPAVLGFAHNATKGETVAVRLRGDNEPRFGRVLERTTTDVQVGMDDGSHAWHAVEDVALVLPEASSFNEGDAVTCRWSLVTGSVLARTTTDVLLRMDDGREVSFGIEDLAKQTSPVAQTLAVPFSGNSILRPAPPATPPPPLPEPEVKMLTRRRPSDEVKENEDMAIKFLQKRIVSIDDFSGSLQTMVSHLQTGVEERKSELETIGSMIGAA